MNDLISRQAAIDALKDWYDGMIISSFRGIEKVIKALPSAQPEELIRCKECKFYWSENHVCAEIGADDGVCHVHVGDDDYCSAAERKEE